MDPFMVFQQHEEEGSRKSDRLAGLRPNTHAVTADAAAFAPPCCGGTIAALTSARPTDAAVLPSAPPLLQTAGPTTAATLEPPEAQRPRHASHPFGGLLALALGGFIGAVGAVITTEYFVLPQSHARVLILGAALYVSLATFFISRWPRRRHG